MDLSASALKYAVKNAYEHGGRASVAAVVGKLKALFPDAPAQACVEAARAAVEKVARLSGRQLEQAFKAYEKEGFELAPPPQRTGLPPLAWAKEEEVVTRFAPNPNGPFHLGSARAAVLSHAYARAYQGRFLLRFDDTDPKIKKPIPDAEKVFLRDLDYLGCKVDEVYFASDRLTLYIRHVFDLARKGLAYVCRCPPEKWRALIRKKQRCPCAARRPSHHLDLLEKMQRHELKEGEAVARLKTDLAHPDPSVRDWWLARVVDRPQHPRVQGWHLWPSYNLASAIDDHVLGVTLIIRGQEHQQNEVKQRFLYDYLGWRYPHTLYTGRLKLEGAVLSTSKIARGIADGTYSGWDDPRLGTLQAFRRRGFQGKAVADTLLELGTRSSDASVEWKKLAAKNQALIAPRARRAVFFARPIRLLVHGAPARRAPCEGETVSLAAGVQAFVVDRNALEARAGKVVRLREAYNARIERVGEHDAQASFAGLGKLSCTVPWLAEGMGAPARVRFPEGWQEGLASPWLARARPDDFAQLDGIGFARVDRVKNGTAELWWAHA